MKVAQIESQILPSRQKAKLNFKHLTSLIVSEKSILRDLWSSTWLLHSQILLWNGFMQTASDGIHPGVSSILFMPMIDQKSTDASCILSTMHFVCNQLLRHKMTPVLTFNQPLYWKAMETCYRHAMFVHLI